MGTEYWEMRCIKILLFIFNLTFWLAGLAVIAFGLWLRFGGVMADLASDKKSPEYFFMVDEEEGVFWFLVQVEDKLPVSVINDVQRVTPLPAAIKMKCIYSTSPIRNGNKTRILWSSAAMVQIHHKEVQRHWGPLRSNEPISEADFATMYNMPSRPCLARYFQLLFLILANGLYVLVGAGAIMATVGFFGCCGAARESQCLLGAFFACLLVIFAAEITAGVFAFIGKKVAIQEAQKIYEDIYDDYMKNPGKVNKTIYHYHVALQCCGKDSTEQTGLPCPENIQLPKNCLDEIQNVVDAHLHLVGIIGIAIAGTTIFGMVFSMVLCCAIRNTRDMI